MSIIYKILSIFHSDKSEFQALTPEIKELMEFRKEVMSLQEIDRFIARSDYAYLRDKYSKTYTFFENALRANTLDYYCEKNALEIKYAENFINEFEDVCLNEKSSIIGKHNENYIKQHLKEEKEYLDTILLPVDPKIRLDEEQRRVVLSDEDYTLVIAGAGAGKTTTVSAKVRYLVEKKGISPDQILVISFTNKAVGELRDKINKDLGIPCPVTTFHKTGYAILRRQDAERRMIVDQGFMFNVINNYLKENILENPELVDKLILFFGSYFDAPYEGEDLNDFFNYISKADFSTIRGNIDEYSEKIINERDQRTTLMIKNIPRNIMQSFLMEIINKKFNGLFNFFYLPIDFIKKENAGYAFINFKNSKNIVDFYIEFNEKPWSFCPNRKCFISYARIQGFRAITQHFSSSNIMLVNNGDVKPYISDE